MKASIPTRLSHLHSVLNTPSQSRQSRKEQSIERCHCQLYNSGLQLNLILNKQGSRTFLFLIISHQIYDLTNDLEYIHFLFTTDCPKEDVIKFLPSLCFIIQYPIFENGLFTNNAASLHNACSISFAMPSTIPLGTRWASWSACLRCMMV